MLGCAGLALLPGWSDPPLGYDDDEAMYPVYETALALGIPVMITSSHVIGPDMSYSMPQHIQRVALDFPELTIVVGHACWPWTTQACALAMRCQNVYLMPEIYMHVPNIPGSDDYVRAANGSVIVRPVIAGSGAAFRVPVEPGVVLTREEGPAQRARECRIAGADADRDREDTSRRHVRHVRDIRPVQHCHRGRLVDILDEVAQMRQRELRRQRQVREIRAAQLENLGAEAEEAAVEPHVAKLDERQQGPGEPPRGASRSPSRSRSASVRCCRRRRHRPRRARAAPTG